MGSQIYIGYELADCNNTRRILVARHYDQVYGPDLVSRVKGVISFFENYKNEIYDHYKHIPQIADTNFDKFSIAEGRDIITDFFIGVGWDIFNGLACDYGKAFVMLYPNNEVKYCVVTDEDVEFANPLTAAEFLAQCYIPDMDVFCGANHEENCEYLRSFRVMTRNELKSFMAAKYNNYQPAWDDDKSFTKADRINFQPLEGARYCTHDHVNYTCTYANGVIQMVDDNGRRISAKDVYMYPNGTITWKEIK